MLGCCRCCCSAFQQQQQHHYIHKQTNERACSARTPTNSTLKQRQNNELHTLFSMLPHWVAFVCVCVCIENIFGGSSWCSMRRAYDCTLYTEELGVFNMASVWMCVYFDMYDRIRGDSGTKSNWLTDWGIGENASIRHEHWQWTTERAKESTSVTLKLTHNISKWIYPYG